MFSTKWRLSGRVKHLLAASPLFDLYRSLRGPWDLGRWRRGHLATPPPLFKQRLVGTFARRFRTPFLVETGTFFGDMLRVHRRTFRRLYSIELDERLYRRARRRLERWPKIELLHGDSGDLLATLLPRLRGPCLFWLDAHAMIGGVRGKKGCPIREELAAILGADLPGSVLLIDDARLFTGNGTYPSLGELREQVLEAQPAWRCEVEDDVIRCYDPRFDGSGESPGRTAGEAQNFSSSTPRPSAKRLT